MDFQQGQEINAFENSRTYQNLLDALTYEKITSTEVIIFSERARREGFLDYGNRLEVIGDESRAHAAIWIRMLNNGVMPSTFANLTAAYERENYAANIMYRNYARIAVEEGYTDIAAIMSGVANIKAGQALELQRLRFNVETNEVFCKRTEVLWYCINCGHIMSGLCAPEICPVCGFPQSFYRVYNS